MPDRHRPRTTPAPGYFRDGGLVNPNTGEAIGRERRRVVADDTVCHARGRESRVVLPII